MRDGNRRYRCMRAPTIAPLSLAQNEPLCYHESMVAKSLAQAIARAERLSDADQERIGRRVACYVDRITELREKLDDGIRSLDAGLGKPLDIETIIATAHAGYAKS